MKISDSVKYIGVNDHVTDLFEGQYKIKNGISYNSYIHNFWHISKKLTIRSV